MDLVKSRHALSAAENVSLRFSHLQCLSVPKGKEKFVPTIGSFSRRITEQPDPFPPDFWELFFQNNQRE